QQSGTGSRNGLGGDSLKRVWLVAAAICFFTFLGVVTTNTGDRALGPVITSRTRTGVGARDLKVRRFTEVHTNRENPGVHRTSGRAGPRGRPVRERWLSAWPANAPDPEGTPVAARIGMWSGGSGTVEQNVGERQVSEEEGNGSQAGGQHPRMSNQSMILPGFG